MNLSREQEDAIQAMIATFYGLAAGASVAEQALEHIAGLTGSDKAFIGTYDFNSNKGRIEAAFNIEEHYIQSYQEYYSQQNPWLRQSQYFQAEGLVWIGSEILPPEQLTQSEFYELFLSPQAILHTLHAVIRVDGGMLTHVVLTRRPEEDDFLPAQVELCRLFARHAKHAMQAREAVYARNLVRRGLSEIMSQRGIGAAIVDAEGRPLYANETCIEIIEELNASGTINHHDPTPTGRGRAQRLELPREIQKRMGEVSAKCPITIVCEKDEGDYPIVFHIHQVALHDAFSAMNQIAYAIVAMDPERAIHLDAESISQAYQLTPSEARVSALIAVGERIEAAAAVLGITPSTARTHLKRIFEKTRTNRQAELVKLLLDTARRHPIERHFRKTEKTSRDGAVFHLDTKKLFDANRRGSAS